VEKETMMRERAAKASARVRKKYKGQRETGVKMADVILEEGSQPSVSAWRTLRGLAKEMMELQERRRGGRKTSSEMKTEEQKWLEQQTFRPTKQTGQTEEIKRTKTKQAKETEVIPPRTDIKMECIDL